MRVLDIINPSTRIINEILMKTSGADNDWKKSKYYESFLEGIQEQMVYSFNVGSRSKTKTRPAEAGRNFQGKVLNPKNVATQFSHALKNDTLNAVTFDVQVYDEDRGEFTKEVVKDVRLNNIWKDEKVTGQLKVNMGNVSEAILGSAVAAKFIHQGKLVTEQMVMQVAQQLAENRGVYQAKAGKDVLFFRVSIPFMDKKAFYAWVGKDSRNKSLKDYGVDDKTIALFDRRLRASVEYANTSKRVLSAVEEAKQAPKNNKVDVLSDGGDKENQTSTKVDLKILINGRESAKRLLSVKAGDVAQFGQVGGHNFENINEFFSTTLGIVLPDNLRSYFYDVSTKGDEAKQQKQHNYENGFQMAYANALRQVKARASKSESDFIQDVYKGLMYHLTRNEPGVEMVILDPDGKKAFSELSFGPEFKEALEELSLYVVETGGTEGFGIAIYGFPQGAVAKKYVPSRKDADSKLIELRSQLTKSFNVRNRVGMGNLLKKIADIETQLERQSQHQQNQQQHQPAQQQHHQQTQQNRDNKIVPNNTNGQPDALSHMATQVNVPGMQQKRKTAKPLTTVGQDEFDNDEEM